MRHACLAIVAKQDYLTQILPRIDSLGREKSDWDHGIYMKIYYHNMTTTIPPFHTIDPSSGTASCLRVCLLVLHVSRAALADLTLADGHMG